MFGRYTVLLFWITTITCVCAQPRVTDTVHKSNNVSLESFPLRSFHVIGNHAFSGEHLLAATGMQIGRKVTPATFQVALKRLTNSGVFESIEFEYSGLEDGYQITFRVTEVSNLYPVRFKGMDESPEFLHNLLRAKIPLYTGKAPPDGPMPQLIEGVLEKHRSTQEKKVRIINHITPRADSRNEFELVFQPRSSIKTIAFVTFENSGVISPFDLQRRFNQIAMGVPFSLPRLQELLLHNVTPFYEEKGYLGVTFCQCSTEPDSDTEGILVHVRVKQGSIYQFGNIVFTENPLVDTSKLTGMVGFQTGETANMSQVQKALTDIEQHMKSIGHMKVLTRHERNVRPEDLQVDIRIAVQPGAIYRFGRLAILGLDIEGEAAVRKRWALKFGQPFSSSYPNTFLRHASNMFDNLSKVNSKLHINEQSKQVDVELNFQ